MAIFPSKFSPTLGFIFPSLPSCRTQRKKMKKNMEEEEQQHIVMFPFMAQGHIIPFVALAGFISQRKPSYTITIVNTPLNIKHLRSTLSSSSTSIRFAELPFCSSDHGLPPDSENTDNLNHNHFIALAHASQSLQHSFHDLLSNIVQQESRIPLCIIADVFLGWTVDVARSVGSSHVVFSTGGAYGTAAYFSIWLNLPHRFSDSDEFNVPGFPDSYRFHRSQLHRFLRAADGTDSWSTFFQKQISLSLGSDCLLCNTVEEIEPTGLELLRKNTSFPVWAIGPLLPPQLLINLPSSSSSGVTRLRAGKEPGIATVDCIEWLETHPSGSVIYISFGSQNTITASQMMELAMGLESSGYPFIWVQRPPLGFDPKEEFRSEWLPEGFEERLKKNKQGLLVRKWAPQLEILTHKSTGVFISHCGWNSIMESLSQGIPIIGWPLGAEQAYNSKMMEEEMGVCVELTRGVEGKVVSGDVEKVIAVVMERDEMRKKAMEIAEKMRASIRDDDGGRKGSSVKALDDFLEALRRSRGERFSVLSPN